MDTRKVGCHPCKSVGIAKRLYVRTDRQPTYMSCLRASYIFVEIGDLTDLRHFPNMSNLAIKSRCKITKIYRISCGLHTTINKLLPLLLRLLPL